MRASSLLALLATVPCYAGISPTIGKPGIGFYVLTDDNRLVSFCDTAVASASPPMAITGLQSGDSLVAIDVRPLNQQLYGLARNTTSGGLALYHLSPETGTANLVGPAQPLVDASGTPVATAANRFDIDFNPAVDRLRIVSTSGLNVRMNPNTGDYLDSSETTAGMNPDGPINGATTGVDGTAYTNNDPVTGITTQYTFDSSTDSIYIQNAPNSGTQTEGKTVTISQIVGITAVRGFDIAPGVNAPSSNAAAPGSAYAILSTGLGFTNLYRINLANGSPTFLGALSGYTARSLAIRTQLPVAVGLSEGGSNLVLFRTTNPGVANTIPLNTASLASGETLVGIDFRPLNGQLMGLGVNADANSASLYLLDPKTGAMAMVGIAGQAQFVEADGTTPVDLPVPTSGYGFDFNPTADRIRVVTPSGLNFRINPTNGAPVDGNYGGAAGSVSGVNPDGNISGGGTRAMETAYTNSYANSAAGSTTQYTLNSSNDSLWIQNPPNSGTQTQQKVVKVGSTTVDFSAVCGFDITAEGGTSGASNTPSNGHGWAALRTGSSTGLYRIELSTGAAINKGPISGGGSIAGLAVAGEAGNGHIPISWPSGIGSVYSIETSEDLINWTPYAYKITATQTTTTVPVPRYEGEKRRYWRIVLP
ncbi:DUF4394 domain-containing protein [Luteolibacter sp. GHJ8]|uniref:DUF4394 domain-containing protein n=1 Tax=Luteolibacter rhizosphaerae TaxID=2989719 RepID=A0ABT3G1F0_9BACT|nr:DUF4394 domain-containing protein [Luteolibacter rhizosphaerae]MCW1913336.1 DUF4394 domain-containing protein [Luteolibacter rhizosphaerae]